MIRDPARRGMAVAALFRDAGPRLFDDLVTAGAVPVSADGTLRAQARAEWDCFALYACVRGLVAAGGFNLETAAAIDALHEHALAGGTEAGSAPRALFAQRYAEYGAIGQSGGAAGAVSLTRRLGEAAARHMLGGEPSQPVSDLVGSLHEALAEGAAAAARGEPPRP
ncbi:MAG TPA: hypothetical protein VI792_00490 [Candidatus Eisenbacteria bacterium]